MVYICLKNYCFIDTKKDFALLNIIIVTVDSTGTTTIVFRICSFNESKCTFNLYQQCSIPKQLKEFINSSITNYVFIIDFYLPSWQLSTDTNFDLSVSMQCGTRVYHLNDPNIMSILFSIHIIFMKFIHIQRRFGKVFFTLT